MNISSENIPSLEKVADFFQILSQPIRLRILEALWHDEACVCHLEALLGERQAYISQQLMSMREAGVVDFRRESRNIFYHLSNPSVNSLLETAFEMIGQPLRHVMKQPVPGCPCPKCNPGVKDCPSEHSEL